MQVSKEARRWQPGPGYDFTDTFGDKLTISPAGEHKVLLEITQQNGSYACLELNAVDVLPVGLELIAATGRTSDQLKKEAIRKGLVRASTIPQNRAQRRAGFTGASFMKGAA